MHVAEHKSQTTRARIQVRGLVQGVGFRPYIFSLARQHALKGQVLNNNTGVLIDVEGDDSDIEQFINEIALNPPPLSQIESIQRHDISDATDYQDFRIVLSARGGEKFVPVSADVATCADCLREMFDTRDRRHRYPFINCTNCGPRFTIIEAIPYDREQTTMRAFTMCEECRAEYENPLDRRFHAEPTACARCGPRLFLIDASGGEIETERTFVGAGLVPARVCGKEWAGTSPAPTIPTDDFINQTRSLLSIGHILAIKGIGGFHLACDALNTEAVERLRHRKHREDKPFALMANSVEIIGEYCFVSKAEEELLTHSRRPVVLLERKDGAMMPTAVAPGVNSLGFMLPYSPLHYLLLENFDRPVVLTSGNVSDEPISYENDDALERLSKIADYFLLHDRRIHIRTDDSVTRVTQGREMVLRRSRGYGPAPIKTAFKFEREILACGAELKNTFCLARDNYAFVSHHIGDLENLETLRSFTEGIEHFKQLFHLQPEAIAYDLHPEYLSTKYAHSLDEIPTKIGVQHHHAHVASCMVDNNIEGEVIGVALDGLGFGTDGKLWGGEFFVADFLAAERVAHLEYVPMPGGAKAIREPWRMAAVYLHKTFGDDFLNLKLPFVESLDKRAWTTLRRMIATGTNSPETSSMGRLFDAVAGLTNLRAVANYEGQAAIEFEAMIDLECTQRYEFESGANENSINENSISAAPVIRGVVKDLLDGIVPSKISTKFHQGVAHLILSIARRVRDERGLNRVVLSGGVFQNMFLLGRTCRMLKSDNFDVFTHSRVPSNDGGISLGQAAVANARLAAGGI